MKTALSLLLLAGLFSCTGNTQEKTPATAPVSDTASAEVGQLEPWKESQLLEPGELAARTDLSATHIFNIGTAGSIKNAIKIGPASEIANIETFRQQVSTFSRDAEIIIYCGCCPFSDCPNIRPAFEVLNELKFKNPRLLNLPKNLKADWIDKGYPMND